MTGTLVVQNHGPVVVATIKNEERMNSLDSTLRRELTDFWAAFSASPEWKVCVLTGSGERAFCAGRDLKETADSYATGEKLEFEATKEMGYPHLQRLGKPVIAAVNGHALAGGFGIALGCHLRLCTENASFGAPQAAMGRGTELPLRLARVGVPHAVIMDMTLTGEKISGARAHEIGLVSRIFPSKAEMMEAALSVATTLAGNTERVVQGVASAWESGLLELPSNVARPLWDQALGGAMTEDQETRDRTARFAQRRS